MDSRKYHLTEPQKESKADEADADVSTKQSSLFLLYVQGLSEKIQIACCKLKVRTIFKSGGTLRNILTRVEDQDTRIEEERRRACTRSPPKTVKPAT